MNYKPIIMSDMESFCEEDLSYCEIIYTLLRELKIKKISELLHTKDEDFYTAIRIAKEFEKK